MALSPRTNVVLDRYNRQDAPLDGELRTTMRYLVDELGRLENVVNDLADSAPQAADRAPPLPRNGLVRLAKTWNPGEGANKLYLYDATWKALALDADKQPLSADLSKIANSNAWTPFTPTLVPSVGSFTSVTADGAFLQLGKTAFIRVKINIITNGSAGGFVKITGSPALPLPKDLYQALTGTEIGTTGSSLSTRIQTDSGIPTLLYTRYDTTYIGGDGALIILNGSYEVA